MKFHHIRNATALLTLGERRLLIDPMFCDPGAMPPLKLRGPGRRRNPLVPLPEGAHEVMDRATDLLITHEHPDHFDRLALAWARDRGIATWSSAVDAPNLRKKGLQARALYRGAMGMDIEVIEGRHGRGWAGWLMGPVSGVYLACPGEPSVYLTGDTVLTETVREALARLQPEVVIAPAGSANFGVGGDIIFSMEELIELVRLAPGQVIFNHLESLDHCPTTRDELVRHLNAEGLRERVMIPEDGEVLHIKPRATRPTTPELQEDTRRPGFQKTLTAALLSGT